MNKKLNKFIKITIYVVAGLLILYFINMVILKPEMQKIEESRTLTKIEKKDPIIIYIQMTSDLKNKGGNTVFKKGELSTGRTNLKNSNCVFGYWYSDTGCFPKDSYRVLSTDTDQELIKKAIGSEYGTAYHKDSTVSIFQDINKDGIKDAVIYQTSEPTSSIGLQDYTVYSATGNKVLWGVSKTMIFDEISVNAEEVKIIPSENTSDMIVIFEPKYFNKDKYNRYLFYKYQDDQYAQIQPTKKDWQNYWQTVTTGNLFWRIINNSI